VEPSVLAMFTSQFMPKLPFDLRHNNSMVRVLGASMKRGTAFLYEIEAQDGSTAWVAPWELRSVGRSLGYSKLDKEARV
jgi:hypothetical protein